VCVSTVKETAGPATTTRFWALSPPHRRVPHISLVFREMWDTAALALKPVAVLQLRTGAPCSHQRTWAENDGRSPTTAFRSGPTRFSLGPEESWAFGPPWKHRPPLCRLDRSVPGFPTSRCCNDHVCGFPQENRIRVNQRHESRQEIRGSGVERSAVQRSFLGSVFRQSEA